MTTFLDRLVGQYQLILCDLWGCVHDGVAILPGVIEQLDRWKGEGATIVFLTNAPRPASAVAAQLKSLGLPDRLNGSIATSGDTALAWIANRPGVDRLGFIGSSADAQRLKDAGLHFAEVDDQDAVICCGFDERGFELQRYDAQLQTLAERGVEMFCLNPDRVVHRGGVSEPCAGAIAQRYGEFGGSVKYFGKPYLEIYEQAMAQVRANGCLIQRNEVLAIGDSVATDYVGAANAGIDFVFVSGGIDGTNYTVLANELFDAAPGLLEGSARPVAIVSTLGVALTEISSK